MNEVGLSISFADRSFISEYAIQELHGLFMDELPHVERAHPTPGPDILPLQGHSPLNVDQPLSRWWFKSADERFVLQLQENFFGFNWRRIAPVADKAEYPGYEEMKARFDRYFAKIREWQISHGQSCPRPIAGELLYDDVIEIQQSTEPVKISSYLSFWNSVGQNPVAGWNVNWVESFSKHTDKNESVMKFAALLAGFAKDEDPEQFVPVIRLNFAAMGMLKDIAGIDTFFEDAHLYIGARFKSIVSEQAQAAWGRKG